MTSSRFGNQIVYILDSRLILNGTPTDLSSRWWLNDIFYFVKLIRVRRSIKAKFRNQTKNFHTFFSCFIHTRETFSRLIIFLQRLRELWVSEWMSEEKEAIFFLFICSWHEFTSPICVVSSVSILSTLVFGVEIFYKFAGERDVSSMKSFRYL